jgi:hypothetical protein
MREVEHFEWPEGWIKAPMELSTKEAALAAFDESSRRIIETVEGFSNDQWNAPLETDDGVTDRFERCRFMTLHLWYHSGQLNFIQTLMGDDAWHWK